MYRAIGVVLAALLFATGCASTYNPGKHFVTDRSEIEAKILANDLEDEFYGRLEAYPTQPEIDAGVAQAQVASEAPPMPQTDGNPTASMPPGQTNSPELALREARQAKAELEGVIAEVVADCLQAGRAAIGILIQAGDDAALAIVKDDPTLVGETEKELLFSKSDVARLTEAGQAIAAAQKASVAAETEEDTDDQLDLTIEMIAKTKIAIAAVRRTHQVPGERPRQLQAAAAPLLNAVTQDLTSMHGEAKRLVAELKSIDDYIDDIEDELDGDSNIAVSIAAGFVRQVPGVGRVVPRPRHVYVAPRAPRIVTHRTTVIREVHRRCVPAVRGRRLHISGHYHRFSGRSGTSIGGSFYFQK